MRPLPLKSFVGRRGHQDVCQKQHRQSIPTPMTTTTLAHPAATRKAGPGPGPPNTPPFYNPDHVLRGVPCAVNGALWPETRGVTRSTQAPSDRCGFGFAWASPPCSPSKRRLRGESVQLAWCAMRVPNLPCATSGRRLWRSGRKGQPERATERVNPDCKARFSRVISRSSLLQA